MIEEFKDVEGFEDYFQVSNFGNVYSKRSGRILKLTESPEGYLHLSTRVGGVAYSLRVHRLVAKAFISNPQNKPQVNHKDGNKKNNNFQNLEWNTPKENVVHAFDTGLAKPVRGSLNENSKMSPQVIEEIKLSYVPYCRTFGTRALAKLYGVHHTQISRVVRHKRKA